jgi:hypothetical protein
MSKKNSDLEHTAENGIHGTFAQHVDRLDLEHTEECSYLHPAIKNNLTSYDGNIYDVRKVECRTTLPYYKKAKVHFSTELVADDWDYKCLQVESRHLNCPGSV